MQRQPDVFVMSDLLLRSLAVKSSYPLGVPNYLGRSRVPLKYSCPHTVDYLNLNQSFQSETTIYSVKGHLLLFPFLPVDPRL